VVVPVQPAAGRRVSSTSCARGDFSSTWAMEGGRPRFRFVEYALVAWLDEGETKVGVDIRRDVRDVRRWFSASPAERLPETLGGFDDGAEVCVGDSGMADKEDMVVPLGLGGNKEDAEDVEEDESE
jgi:hypothetical protein